MPSAPKATNPRHNDLSNHINVFTQNVGARATSTHASTHTRTYASIQPHAVHTAQTHACTHACVHMNMCARMHVACVHARTHGLTHPFMRAQPSEAGPSGRVRPHSCTHARMHERELTLAPRNAAHTTDGNAAWQRPPRHSRPEPRAASRHAGRGSTLDAQHKFLMQALRFCGRDTMLATHTGNAHSSRAQAIYMRTQCTHNTQAHGSNARMQCMQVRTQARTAGKRALAPADSYDT